MNFVKKAFVLLISVTLFSMNIECMQQQSVQYDQQEVNGQRRVRNFPPRLQSQRQPEPQTKSDVPWFSGIWNLADYIVQLGSIYSIDSTNEKVVGDLAITRGLLNMMKVVSSSIYLYKSGLRFSVAGIPVITKNIPDLIYILSKGYNVSRDFGIWKDAETIAASNRQRIDAKTLNNTKYKHYLWLTFNKFLPTIVAISKGHKSFTTYFSHIFATLSESYRQNLMYSLIEKKRRVV